MWQLRKQRFKEWMQKNKDVKFESKLARFLCAAKYIHDNKYMYDKITDIQSTRDKIVVECPSHGYFETRVLNHMYMVIGCTKCYRASQSKPSKHTLKSFLKEARDVHGDKYDYGAVSYTDYYTNVEIICPTHGPFFQVPCNHIYYKNGCVKCYNDRCRKTTEKFTLEAKAVHGDKYLYHLVKYTNTHNKVTIVCPEHGEFDQIADQHLHGKECPKCSSRMVSEKRRKRPEEFIKQAITIHGSTQYDYTETKYIDNQTKIKVRCIDHGYFLVKPFMHTFYGTGCRACKQYGYSKIQMQWITYLEKSGIKIQHALSEEGEFCIPGTTFKADGYCKATNTVYEFYGNFWHGNPRIFSQEKIAFGGKTFGDLYAKTIEREALIKNLGYNIVTIWESEFRKILKYIKRIQRNFRLKRLN